MLLTGRPAFQAENVLQVLARVANDTPPLPSSLVPDVPPDVDRILARALAKDPAARYPCGEDMAADIEAALASRPLPADDDLPVLQLVEEPPPAPPELLAAGAARDGRPATRGTLADPIPPPLERAAGGRTWWPVAIAAAVVLALTAVALLWPRSGPKARSSEPAAARDLAAARTRPPEAPAAPQPEPEPEPTGDGRLEIDFEHHLHGGRIQVWVDEDEVLDEEFDSRVTRKVLSLRLRKGEVQEVRAVPAGRHDVRVRLQWSGRTRTRRIAGTFAAGETRTLRVRVSRIFNELSLEWS